VGPAKNQGSWGRLFKRILVANRAEIALRIIRTCREMGLETVAVYTDVDRDTLPVRLADQAVALREPGRYLDAAAVIAAARAAGAPGFAPPGRSPEASASLRTGPGGAPKGPATGTTAPGLERVRLFPAPPSGGPGSRRPSAIRRLPDRPAEMGPHPPDASPPRLLPAPTPPDAARGGMDGPPTSNLRPAVQAPGPPREGPTTEATPTSPGGPTAPRPVVERVQRARGASAGKEPEAEELPGGPLAEETEEGPNDPDPGTSEDQGQVGGPP
jgi:hypothetical protein